MRAVDTFEWACVLCCNHIQNDWVEQQICIKFCVKLEHSSTETIWMIQGAAAMGTWWLAASSPQSPWLCIISPADFFGKTSNHAGDSAPLQPRFGTCSFWIFPKLKSSLKSKRFQTINEIQENMMGQLMEIVRTVWGTKVPTLKESESLLSYVQCFLYLICFSINV